MEKVGEAGEVTQDQAPNQPPRAQNGGHAPAGAPQGRPHPTAPSQQPPSPPPASDKPSTDDKPSVGEHPPVDHNVGGPRFAPPEAHPDSSPYATDPAAAELFTAPPSVPTPLVPAPSVAPSSALTPAPAEDESPRREGSNPEPSRLEPTADLPRKSAFAFQDDLLNELEKATVAAKPEEAPARPFNPMLEGLGELENQAQPPPPETMTVPRTYVIPKKRGVGSVNTFLLGRILLIVLALAVAAGGVYAGVKYFSPDEEPAKLIQDGGPKKPKMGKAKAAFVKKADRMCAQSMKALKGLPQPTNLKQARQYARVTKKVGVGLIAGLEGLKKPKENRKLLNEWLRANHQAVPLVRDLEAAIANADAAAIQKSVGEMEQLGAYADALGRRYGFTDCVA